MSLYFKTKIILLKFLNRKVLSLKFLQKITNPLKLHIQGYTMEDLIKKYAPGKSFVDIGSLWAINGYFSFLAESCGARRVIAVDILTETEEFRQAKRQKNSKVEFICGDIHLPETTQKIGTCDVVFCSGVLYHSPNPLHLIMMLRSICRETLILKTQLIPEVPGIKNAAVFYPFLDKKQRKLYDRGAGIQKAITEDYDPKSGYGNWFWGPSPSCVKSMLECAGFTIEKSYLNPFHGCFICKTAPVKFMPVSGELAPDYNQPKPYKHSQ